VAKEERVPAELRCVFPQLDPARPVEGDSDRVLLGCNRTALAMSLARPRVGGVGGEPPCRAAVFRLATGAQPQLGVIELF
jgi:hypothetical protein